MNSQYPSHLSMRCRSNTATPIEGFPDLHHRDFVSIIGWVSHRKLDRLVLAPYQRAILRRGVNRRSEFDEVENPDVLMGMEYARSVGTMVVDELAEVNDQVSGVVDILKARIEELEAKVVVMEDERHSFCWEAASLKAANSECILQMVELMMEVRGMRLFQVTLQHGLGNPIVVEDDEEEVEDSEVGSDFHQDDVVFSDIGRLSPGGGLLVEIGDDPWDVAYMVERAEERAELRARHLTMDDQAWREAMETEQLS